MNNAGSTGLTIFILAAVVLAAVVSNRFSERTRIPAPFLFLVGAAAVSDIFPGVEAKVPISLVDQTSPLASTRGRADHEPRSIEKSAAQIADVVHEQDTHA